MPRLTFPFGADGLLAPALVGLAGDDYLDPVAMSDGYRSAMLWCAGLLAAGGVVSWFGLGRAARP